MGNILSIEKKVFPGFLNDEASVTLLKKGFIMGDIFATYVTVDNSGRNKSTWPKDITLATFHGNMEDVASTSALWKRFDAPRIVAFEYPGYGWRIKETASQKAILADVPRQKQVLESDTRVIICGRSIGTFAALQLAVALGPEKCRGLILLSPVLTAIATNIPPPLHRALSFMDFADNDTIAAQLSSDIPVLILHGVHDVVVPLSNAIGLRNTIHWAQYHAIAGANHNDMIYKSEVWEKIDRFIIKASVIK
ncbi:MAG: alpha/beta hydrolase [Flavobacteriales bacterium]|jgi:pimeloyl-ACP methyl ester carboxylesterase